MSIIVSMAKKKIRGIIPKGKACKRFVNLMVLFSFFAVLYGPDAVSWLCLPKPCHERCPARLMACSQTASVFGVKVLVKGQHGIRVRIAPKGVQSSLAGTPTVGIEEEDRSEAAG